MVDLTGFGISRIFLVRLTKSSNWSQLISSHFLRLNNDVTRLSFSSFSSCQTVKWPLMFGSAIFDWMLSLGPTAAVPVGPTSSNACGNLGVSAGPSKA